MPIWLINLSISLTVVLSTFAVQAQDPSASESDSASPPIEQPSAESGPTPSEPEPTPPPSTPPSEPAAQPPPAPAAQPAEQVQPTPVAQPAAQPPPPPPPQYQQGNYQQPPPAQTQYQAPPPAPEPEDNEDRDDDGESGFPSFSIRLDPFNWIIYGHLGVELEVEIWKFISLELVPVFVVNDEPPALELFGMWESVLYQKSNGLGPISGTSIGVGFWLSGKALEGTVLRVIYTNYGYTYETRDEDGPIDEVSHTERRLYGFFGSHSNWGPFTIASGIGLGVELNQQQRCFESGYVSRPKTSGCTEDDELHIALGGDLEEDGVTDLNGWLHPAYIFARISLGIYIDI